MVLTLFIVVLHLKNWVMNQFVFKFTVAKFIWLFLAKYNTIRSSLDYMESKIFLEHYDFGILLCCNVYTVVCWQNLKHYQEFQPEFCSKKQLNSADVMWIPKYYLDTMTLCSTLLLFVDNFFFLDDLNKQVSTCCLKAKNQKDNSQKLKKANKPLNPKKPKYYLDTMTLCTLLLCVDKNLFSWWSS